MGSDFVHTYSVTECPDCGSDLRQPGGVTIETYEEGEGNRYLPSRLDNEGTVQDVDDVIEDGLHSDTLCGKCGLPLNDYEAL